MNQLTLTLLLFLFSFSFSFGQHFTDADVEELLKPVKDEKINEIKTTYSSRTGKPLTRLVSKRTFSETVKEDFYKVSKTSDKNDAIVGKYASLSIDSDKSTFTLTPFSGIGSDSTNIGLFRNIYSFDISGSLNNDKNFSFKDYKKLSLGFSLVHVRESYKYCKSKRPDDDKYERVYNAVLDEMKKEASKELKTIIDSLHHNAIYAQRDTNKLIELYHTKIMEAENKLIGNARTRKILYWHKFVVKPFTWETLTYIPQSLLQSATAVNKTTLLTPSLKYIFNWYMGTYKNHNLFINASAGISMRHSLSEITTQMDWYKFSILSDSTRLGSSTKIFTPAETRIRSDWRPDFSGQFIYLNNKKKSRFGLEVFFSANWLITPTELTGKSHLKKLLLGVIFPISTKDTKTTVVIEPFIEWKFFKNYWEEDSRNMGVKFSVPFNSLF